MPSLTITRYTVNLFSSRPSAIGPVIATIQFCAAPPDAEPPPWLRCLPCTTAPPGGPSTTVIRSTGC